MIKFQSNIYTLYNTVCLNISLSKLFKMGKAMPDFLVCQIVTLKEAGMTYMEIAKKLSLTSWRSAESAMRRYRKNGSFEAKKPSGRPPTLNEREARRIVGFVKRQPKLSNEQICQKWNSFTPDKLISKYLVRKTLRNAGFNSHSAAKTIYLRYRNRSNRKRWCAARLRWTEQDWKCIIFR